MVKLALVDEARAAALCIPKGKGDGKVEPPLGGAGAAADDDAAIDGAEACDDEAVAPLAMMLSCGMPASTHVGGAVACRTALIRACMSRMLARVPVAPGW